MLPVAILAFVAALIMVTAIHEAGHFLAVLAKRGRVLAVKVGRGPVGWRTTVGRTELLVAAIPLGGRIRYDGVAPGTGQAVIAISGAVANLAAAFLTFAVVWLLGPGGAPGAATASGPLGFALGSTSAWFWVVPGAIGELVTTGSALELRSAVRGLAWLVADRPLGALPYAVGALSALWAALNLIPIPGLDTDGWHIARALWRGAGR